MLQDVPLPEMPMPVLQLTRLPGEFGPILRCYGELSRSTVGTLQRELDLLEPLAHLVLTLDLSACEFLDADGIVTILQSFARGGQATGPVAAPRIQSHEPGCGVASTQG
jgi:anti-anti-sigma regulatory factor